LDNCDSRLLITLVLAGVLKMDLPFARQAEEAFVTQIWQAGNGCSDMRETSDDCVHPRKCVYDHQVDKSAAQDVLDHPAKRIELALGGVLNPMSIRNSAKKRFQCIELDGRAVA
jgi:hypothetical protein